MSSASSSSVTGFPSAGLWDCEVPATKNSMLENTPLYDAVTNLVLDYLKSNDNPFGAKEYIDVLGVSPGVVPALPEELIKWWYEPDAVDPEKQNCETHISPVYRAEELGDPQTLDIMLTTLETLKKLGLGQKDEGDPYNQNKDKPAGPGAWLVLRKEVFARNKTPQEQFAYIKALNKKTGSKYEEKPSAIDLAFVVFARYSYKGERYLGDDTGEEKRWTYSRCGETVRYGTTDYPLVVGGFGPGALNVVSIGFSAHEDDGVAGLRKF